MTKRYKVKITSSAESDLGRIWDHVSQQHPGNAVSFLNEMEEKIGGICTFPSRHPTIPESEILQTREYRHLIHKHYRIIYRCTEDTVYILRAFHGAKLLDISSLD